MDSTDTPPKQSPVGSPKSPVDSPGKRQASESPTASPGKERASNSPEQQRSPSPTSEGLLPGDYWTEAAPLEDENDPTHEEVASSTASLSSSVMHYRTIQGRTYHSSRGDAEYWGSNDEKQNESLDLIHHVQTLALDGKLHLAPLKEDIQSAVDIGTGTGLWAIDFADEYPNCEVVGTDLSPIQPSWIPPNLKFEIDDCTQPWTFKPDSLDYVHLRYLTGCIKDWPALFREAYRCTTPGGYVESYDGGPVFYSDDDTLKDTHAIAQWGKLFNEGGKKIGQTFDVIAENIQREGMEDAGFVVVGQKDVKMPLGMWPKDPQMKEMGMAMGFALSADVEGFTTYMATLLGWSKEAILVYAAHMRREIRDTNIHSYFRMRVVWGRKPGY